MDVDIPDNVKRVRDQLGASDVFPVVEGGWFIPTFRVERGAYRAPEQPLPPNEAGINPDVASSVPASGGYYVLTSGEVGALHTLKCGELYLFVAGNPVEIVQIDPGGDLRREVLGPLGTNGLPHSWVPGRVTQGIRPLSTEHPCSVLHLMTVPAFDERDAHVPTRSDLLEQFPQHEKVIVDFSHTSTKDPISVTPPLSYMVSCADCVEVTPFLTVGDEVNGYRFAGAPDGLGAYPDPDMPGHIRIVITHEFFFHAGAVRAHGAPGSFVSEWVVEVKPGDKGSKTLRVVSGRDLIMEQHYWSHSEAKFKTGKSLPFERLCSADLPPESALQFEKVGTSNRLFLGGEETHTKYRPDHGRALAHIVTGPERGTTYELPSLGRLSFENIVLCPKSQVLTLAIGLDDATNHTGSAYLKRKPQSELFIYVGKKQKKGSDIERAGLVGGQLYGIKVSSQDKGKSEGVRWESRADGFGQGGQRHTTGRFNLETLPDTTLDDSLDEPGVALQKRCIERGITQFLRIEDGAWDPRPDHFHDFYFVTTDEFNGNSRLFRLRFDDLSRPADGGTIEILLDGSGGRFFQMLDSITVDTWGRVLLQEDGGKENQLSRTMVYDIQTRSLYTAAQANPDLFDENADRMITIDEESSGIIPVFDLLGEGWYLTGLQAHGKFPSWHPARSSPNWEVLEKELVEPGQLLAIFIPQDLSMLPLLWPRKD